MDKTYNSQNIEQLIYNYWEKQKYFEPNKNNYNNYCIMMPPPNVTGELHMGHAFQHTIMDILIRYHRMLGKNTFWQIGFDHAGIATQIIVEHKLLIETNKTKYDYGRDNFINKIWEWVNTTKKKIAYQIRRLGSSVSWDHEKFTMDNTISDIVTKVFIRLYKDQLIYRGKKLVNWDCKLQTAISDLEVENKEIEGNIYYLRYPLCNNSNNLDPIVATTRPETLFGDVCIAVNPKDHRYLHLIGKFVTVPILNRKIPIISDQSINIIKGTGCVKITPAHDFNDYLISKKHNLPLINIFDFNGNICQNTTFDVNGKTINIFSNTIPVKFLGLHYLLARKILIKELDQLGFLVDIKKHNIIVAYNYRSSTIILPMLTDQWYLRTPSLAKLAIEAVKQGKIKFIPKQYENIYFNWMYNIQDWCISRQIWWGHRIPAWYDDLGNTYVDYDEKTVRLTYNIPDNIKLYQDNDVLDTWFSSSLWTFSTLGWPKNTNLLHNFHPTNVIVSGFDIIYFWIARMIMLTMYLVKDYEGNPQVPFKVVYITGLIKDENGQKMSKSKGNTIDPIDIIDGISLLDLSKKRTRNIMKPQLLKKILYATKNKYPHGIESYGTDALRFTLSSLSTTSRNIFWSMHRLKGYRNFCNKLWNASRFILVHLKNINLNQSKNDIHLLLYNASLIDRWIITKYNQTTKIVCESIENYRFDLATHIIYEFVWYKFCNWYLEYVKILIISNRITTNTKNILFFVFQNIIKLLHPIIPFLTEKIWRQLKVHFYHHQFDKTIMLQAFPQYKENLNDSSATQNFKYLKKIISVVRIIRKNFNIPCNKKLTISLIHIPNKIINLVSDNSNYIFKLVHLNQINILTYVNKTCYIIRFAEKLKILFLISQLLNLNDINNEFVRINKKIIYIDYQIINIYKKINNQLFIKNSPIEVKNNLYWKLHNFFKDKMELIDQYNFLSLN